MKKKTTLMSLSVAVLLIGVLALSWAAPQAEASGTSWADIRAQINSMGLPAEVEDQLNVNLDDIEFYEVSGSLEQLKAAIVDYVRSLVEFYEEGLPAPNFDLLMDSLNLVESRAIIVIKQHHGKRCDIFSDGCPETGIICTLFKWADEGVNGDIQCESKG